MGTIFGREPALIIGAIEAAIIVAIRLGVDVTPDLHAALMGLVVAVAAIITRTQVTPVNG